eukprot:SAG11_NODE_363_length_10162_cov_28.285004_8_plen_46_part_00
MAARIRSPSELISTEKGGLANISAAVGFSMAQRYLYTYSTTVPRY